MITGRQIREARTLLALQRWQVAALTRVVSTAVVRRAERVDCEPPITAAHANAIRVALERAGIEFITGDDGMPAVRLHEPDPA